MKVKTIFYYVSSNGKKPFEEWFRGLKDSVTKSRIRRRIDRLSLGNYGDYKVISGGLCELRLDFGSGYRIYFAEQDNQIVMFLCGGDKSTQDKDIEAAKAYLEELQKRIYHE